MNPEHDHEKRNGRVKSAGTWLYGRFKNRNSGSKLKTLVQALVATSVAGGLTVGAIGYSQALDAKAQLAAVQNQLNAIDLGTGVITIPTPPDLTEAVQQAQSSADAAQGSATAAQTSADAASTSAAAASKSAASAQTSANGAQATASTALAAVPKLTVFPDASVNRLDPPWATLGSTTIKAGTYVIEIGVNASDNSQVRVLFGDGRTITLPNGVGFRNGRAILTFAADTTASFQVDDLVASSGAGSYALPYILATELQGN